jgi:hypothetical protein
MVTLRLPNEGQAKKNPQGAQSACNFFIARHAALCVRLLQADFDAAGFGIATNGAGGDRLGLLSSIWLSGTPAVVSASRTASALLGQFGILVSIASCVVKTRNSDLAASLRALDHISQCFAGASGQVGLARKQVNLTMPARP